MRALHRVLKARSEVSSSSSSGPQSGSAAASKWTDSTLQAKGGAASKAAQSGKEEEQTTLLVSTASLGETLTDAAYLRLLARHYEAVAGVFAAYSPDDIFDEKGTSWEEAKRQNVSLSLQKTTACLRSIRICPELMSVGALEALIK